jgi:hypothetical protein
VGEGTPSHPHTLGARLLAVFSYLAFPKHAVQALLLGFFGTFWNIGFIGYLAAGPAFFIGYLIVLAAISVVVQLALSVFVFRRPDALGEVRSASLWKWHWIKEL